MSPSPSFEPILERSDLLHGRDDTPNLIGFEVEGVDLIRVFTREQEAVNSSTTRFEPFLLLSDENRLKGWRGDCRVEPLAGNADFRRLVYFPDLVALDSAKTYLQKKTGKRLYAPGAPCLYFNDPVQQYLLMSGKTLFRGMCFSELKRMQIDLETYCDARFEFPNAERGSDRITAIAMSDTTGWERVISGREFDEAEMLTEMCAEIHRRDPDVIEGHNFFRFDLTYLRIRAKRYGMDLKLGRNDSALGGTRDRVEFGDRRVTFTYYQIFGRHIIDTWFLAQAYDLRTSELEGHGLKDVARHFGVAPAGRTYIPGAKASWYFDHEPDILFRYALDDVRETRAVSAVLSPTYFFEAQIFPCTYQNVAARGVGSKIDSLLLREYIAQRHSIPAPVSDQAKAAEPLDRGSRALERNVLYCGLSSLHSSIMLASGYFPKSDDLGVLSHLLRELVRRQARTRESGEKEEGGEDTESKALRATYETLSSSLFSYLGFSMGHFHDLEVEGQVAAEARRIVTAIAGRLEQWGARVIKVEASGLYLTASTLTTKAGAEFLLTRELAGLLPAGAGLYVKGPYPAMFSYDAGNHALLDPNGRVRVKGAYLYPRGLERFHRNCLEEMLRLLLEGRDQEIPVLYDQYRDSLSNHQVDISLLKKTETLQESLEDYQMRVKGARRNPRGVYEIALRSGRDYLEGDQVSYYVTGEGANVRVNERARHVSEWERDRPDENVEYYKFRLRDLYERLRPFVVVEEE